MTLYLSPHPRALSQLFNVSACSIEKLGINGPGDEANSIYLRIMEDGIECSTEFQLNTSHLCILLTPRSSKRVSSYCTPHSIHAYLHSAGIIEGDRWSLYQA